MFLSRFSDFSSREDTLLEKSQNRDENRVIMSAKLCFLDQCAVTRTKIGCFVILVHKEGDEFAPVDAVLRCATLELIVSAKHHIQGKL